MKKIHGTHSIQPLTITDAVIAEDAQISESKIALTHTTANLQTDIDNLESTLNAHMEDDADPHGEILQQTTIRTENITSNVSETDRTITVSNPGGGNLLFDVQGDINCNNLGVSGDTSIDGVTSIGGQTHITGNVLIDGDLTVTGRSTTVTSNTIDYDSLLVTPSTANNRTGIIVAPDGTGYEEGEGQSQTTTETITVHDDIVDAAEGMFYAPTRELSNGDLITTLPNRIVRTNPEATEIKATYFIMDEDAEHVIEYGDICATAVNDNDEIYTIIYSDLGFIVRVLNSNLELIREAGPLFDGQDPGLTEVRSFEYNNGKFYALYSFADNSYGIYTYDETYIAKGSDEELPNYLEYGSGSNSVSGLHSSQDYWTELSDIDPVSIRPFTHNGMDYIFIITTGNMFVVDAQTLQLQGYEMLDATDENYDPSNFEDTAYNSVLDPYNKIVYTVFTCFVYGFPVTQFIDAQTYVSPASQAIDDTISTIPVVFDTAFASEQDLSDADTNQMGWIQGVLTDGTILYYSDISRNMYWLDPEEFGDLTMEEAAGQELEMEFSPGTEADFVTHVRRFIVTDEDEDEDGENAASSGSEDSDEPKEPEDFMGVDLIRTRTEEIEVETSAGDTFLGNLLELQKRTNGLNEAAVIVDKNGNLKLFTGDIKLGESTLSDTGEYLNISTDIRALSITTTDKGFKYEASTDAGASNKVIDVQNSSGVSKFFVDKAGNASANTLQIGSSLPVVWNNTDDSITFSSKVTVADRSINLDDSELVISSDNKTDWRILNRNSTVSFYYGNSSLVPQVEIGNNLFDTSSSNLTKTNNLMVCGDANFYGNVTMASGMLMDGIHLGSHDHSGGDMGVILPQTSVSGLKNFVDNINTTIRNCVDTMTTNNTESGINVAYNSTTEKLNFTVNDFTLTLTGEATGSATIAHASNTSLAVTVKNSAKLGGLSLPSGTANTEANKVLRTDANANTTVKTLSISTPVNAGTANIAKIYASTGSETAVKYYTPADFATQILALGGTVKNSHVHTAVNGLTPLRGSGSFAGTSGKRVNLPSSRADTSYTVSITPTANPGGQLGEVWVVKSTAYFTVYNSGTFTGAFDYIVLG